MAASFKLFPNSLKLLLRVISPHLMAVGWVILSSKVMESPEDRKLSAIEHGLVPRVSLDNREWSQLRGMWSLQYLARRVRLLLLPNVYTRAPFSSFSLYQTMFDQECVNNFKTIKFSSG